MSNQVKAVTPRAAHLVRGRVRGRVRVRARARASAKVRRRPPVGRIVTELVTNPHPHPNPDPDPDPPLPTCRARSNRPGN